MCLGTHLARLEMTVAIKVLLEKVDAIECAAPFVRSPNFALRGLSSMPVLLKAK